MANDLNRSIKIYIDNSDAMAKASTLEAKITELRGELQKLNQQGKKDSHEYKSQEKALNKLERSYGNYKNKIQETERVLKNLSGSTYKELKSTRSILRRELEKETRGTEQYTAKLRALDAVQKEINIAQKEMTGNLGRQSSFFSRAADGFNKYFGIVTSAIASITGISFALRKLSQDAAAWDDVYADVMKTTGMTKDEVLDLNEVFKQMDTRTSREQLNMLARDAGKLGLQSKEDILGFVEAANEIQVALGEDLGEGAVREVGKMVDVFTKSTRELEGLDLKGKMLAVGSAINEIGASSSAQEDYLVQFAGRLGGVAAQANIGIDAILGFASVLDQDMQQVEMSATALQQIIIKMMGDPAKFAKIAGVEVSKFTDLVRNDANEAIKVLLRSLNEKGGFAELVPLFDEMGLSGTRAVGVLSSLAGSVDKIEEAQQLANQSMVEGTSMTNEYNIKNTTAQAQLEKLRKAFKDTSEELGMRLNPALLKSTNGFTYIIKALPVLLDFFQKYGGLLFKTTALILAYNVALKANTLWKKVQIVDTVKLIFWYAKEQASLIALNLRYVAGSKNLQELGRSMKDLFAVMKLNPWAIAITALTAVGILLYENARRTRNLTNSAKALADVNKEASKSIAQERAELDLLLTTARNEFLSKEDRQKAIKKLNNISPEYLGNLKLENINTKAATTSVENYTTALMINARQKAIADKVSELYAKRVEKEGEIAEQEARKARAGRGSDIHNIVDRKIGSIKKEIATIDDQIKMYDNLNQAILKNNKIKNPPTSNNDTSSNDPFVPNATPTGAPSTNAYQEALTKLEAYIAREKALIQEKYIAGKISQEEYNRELEYLERERLQKNLELSGLTFEQQQEIELKLFETKKQMIQRIEDQEREHQNKLLEIQTTADKARADKNLAALKAIAKQNEADAQKRFEAENKRKSELAALGFDFANEMGTMVGAAVSGNEDIVASSLKSIINMALDALKLQVQMSVAGATAQSLAQPDSVATFGASGFARAAVLVGLIEAAFAAVKSVVSGAIGNIGGKNSSSSISSSESVTGSRVINQRAAGKYDVIGADDGRRYRGVPYKGLAQTGFVSTPTLMGEQGRELVVSAPDLVRLQRHINYPLILSAINEARSGSVQQRAEGNYSQIQQPTITGTIPDSEILNRLSMAIEKLLKNGVRSAVVLSDIQRKQYLHDTSRKIGSK